MEEKIKSLMSQQEFVDKLLACEEPEQVQALFAENDVELSLEEVKAIGQGLAAMSESDGELSEDDLEGVAGGVAVSTVLGVISGAITVGVQITRNWSRIKNWFRRW